MMGADEQAGRDSLPALLKYCVDHGILDEETTHRIEEYRKLSGVGITRSLRDFGVDSISTEQVIEMVDALVHRDGYSPLLLTAKANPNLTFDNLVPSRRNEFPVDVAKNISRSPANSPYSPLYVYSDVGLGKTHLLGAIANGTTSAQPRFISTVDLDRELERACRMELRAELLEWIEDTDLLLIDDVQFAEGNPTLQQELFSLINRLTAVGAAVVISSDVPPTRLSHTEQRLISRFSCGVIVSLTMPEQRERGEILRQMDEDHLLPEAVVTYLAEQVTDNVRHLKASARQLFAMAAHSDMQLNVDLARVVVPLPEDLHYSTTPPPQEEDAVEAAAERNAEQYKQMLLSAETEEEQVLALQIALGAKLRELRATGRDRESETQLEAALKLLREGKKEEALRCIE